MQGNTRAFDENVTVATKTMPQAPQASQINAMVENLAKRMQENPEDAKGWLMLARSYKVLKRYDESLTAMRKAHALMGDTPDVLLQLADILAIVGHGRLQGEASDLIEKALKLEPENEMGLWLYGLALAEREQYTQAISVWQKLQLHYADQDANYLEIQNLINQAKQAIGQAVVPPKALADSSKAFDQTNTADKGIELTVQLDAKFSTTVKPDDSVFIYAQALQGPKMPLAAVKKQVKDLPLNITLDDSMAMMPSRKLSSVDAVQIVARVSASGQAIAQSGEPIGKLETSTLVNHGVQNLIIDQVVP
jgi:cytochrome c-type biogenesis protein CcmH